MESDSFNKMEKKRNFISQNYAQKDSSNDRMLDLDSQISTFGALEKRSQFARDRDRIIYSTAFRRLEHKAQVYSHEKGDHYRTRLTHTLEVMQIARGIARNLGLNEDLTEAIALGHDIGHTPFGHAGEEILDKIMRGEDDLGGKLKYKINYGGFKHNFHSLKILDVIESKYEDEKGLNLTWQVLEGILKHTKIKKINKITKKEKKWDLSRFVKSDDFFKPLVPEDTFFKNPLHLIDSNNYAILKSSMLNLSQNPNPKHSLTLEGQVVNIADEIAQRQHDLDDGLRDLDLKMKESDVLTHVSNVIDKIIDEIIEEKILDEIIQDIITKNRTFDPISGIVELMENIDVKRTNISTKFNKRILKNILLTPQIRTIILENYYEELDDDFKSMIKLKEKIHDSKIKEENLKWKTIIRDVISYFINDVTQNTLKNITNKELCFYNNNPYFRKDNKDYLDSKQQVKGKTSLIPDDKKFVNRRNYAMSQFVCLSETAKKFDKKIEQYIENRIINSYNVNRFDGKAKFIIRQLFKAYYENPKQMNKSQLNYLSKLINENLDKYYELKFTGGPSVRSIQFDSNNPDFVLKLDDVSRLIKLLKLEVKLEELNNPNINLDLAFLKEINGSIIEISQKWGCLDNESLKIIVFDEILYKINEMDVSSIIKEKNQIKRDKLLFIKCLLENHYSFLSVICDYIAGMTDNYAKKEYENLYLV